ncbi:MAG TPA: ribulose-phosphate 3-epimerase [Deinococcales bacterium]|nr:ribulose-phosphate 3-epimerase [Deinococcales bacterium]
MPLLAPSILAADLTRLGEELRAVEAGGADRVHLDVMDGRFVPNISFGVPVARAARQATRLPLDVHLMIVEPERWVTPFAEAGATGLTLHVEATPNIHRALQSVREHGLRPGVTLNPGTPLVAVEPLLDLVDLALVMSVTPGFGGQAFQPSALARIRELAGWRNERGLRFEIEVDGGVGVDTAPACAAAGADVLVAGSAVFGAPGGAEAGCRALLAALKNGEA